LAGNTNRNTSVSVGSSLYQAPTAVILQTEGRDFSMQAHVQVQDISAVGGQNITRNRHGPAIKTGSPTGNMSMQMNSINLQGYVLRIYLLLYRHAVAQLVEALRYKPDGRGFDSRWCDWNFTLT